MKTKQRHTPGPWNFVINCYGPHDALRHAIFADDAPKGFKHPAIVDTEANARLVAAAPDLYDILKKIVDSDMAMREEDEGRKSPLLRKARAALAMIDSPA